MAITRDAAAAAAALTTALGPYVYRCTIGGTQTTGRAAAIVRAALAGRLDGLQVGAVHLERNGATCWSQYCTYGVLDGEVEHADKLGQALAELSGTMSSRCGSCTHTYGSAACAACPRFQVPHV